MSVNRQRPVLPYTEAEIRRMTRQARAKRKLPDYAEETPEWREREQAAERRRENWREKYQHRAEAERQRKREHYARNQEAEKARKREEWRRKKGRAA